MSKKKITLIMMVLLITVDVVGAQEWFKAPEWRIPLLFTHPRKGYWTTLDWEEEPWDNSSIQHFLGCFMLTGILDTFMEDHHAAILTFGIGILKEVEDGFREGLSVKDIIANTAGVFLYMIVRDTHIDKRLKIKRMNNSIQLVYCF